MATGSHPGAASLPSCRLPGAKKWLAPKIVARINGEFFLPKNRQNCGKIHVRRVDSQADINFPGIFDVRRVILTLGAIPFFFLLNPQEPANQNIFLKAFFDPQKNFFFLANHI